MRMFRVWFRTEYLGSYCARCVRNWYKYNTESCSSYFTKTVKYNQIFAAPIHTHVTCNLISTENLVEWLPCSSESTFTPLDNTGYHAKHEA